MAGTVVKQVQEFDIDGAGFAIRNSANVPGIETSEIVPMPEGPLGGSNSTRADQTTLDGGAFTLRCACEMNRLILRIASQGSNPTIAVSIYQAPAGGSGIADRIATITALAIAAAGNLEGVFAEGIVSMKPGLIYILFGRDSGAGSYTVNTYNHAAQLHLLAQNVPASTHPTYFTTALPANAPPAQFDPLVDPVLPGAAETALICRLRNA